MAANQGGAQNPSGATGDERLVAVAAPPATIFRVAGFRAWEKRAVRGERTGGVPIVARCLDQLAARRRKTIQNFM
jgi:hypothetical protein